MTSEGNEYLHICKIQVHRIETKNLDKKLGSHDYYEYFRKYFAGCMKTVGELFEDLVHIAGSNRLD